VSGRALGAAALEHVRALRAAARAAPDAPAEHGALMVDLARVLAFRDRATRLDHRLPAGSHREAAYGGLQDTVPRAALSSLHARMEDVCPTSWEDPDLWQVWFRGADYVVPRTDLGVFTLGALPRQPERAAALQAVAVAVSEVLDGRPRSAREVGAELPAALARAGQDPTLVSPLFLRLACVTGRYRIRWDARTVTVIPAAVAELEVDEARLELARRFLAWHGPATAAQFARWAGVSRADAAETWARLAPDLIPVGVDGGARHLLARDEEVLARAAPQSGVRLLPSGDPFLVADRGSTGAATPPVPPPTRDDRGAPVTSTLLNSLAGRVLLDGRLRGAWGRNQHRLSIHLWHVGGADREQVLAEALRFAGPIGRPVDLRWLS
jgi:winged helix DNA-binding protein